MLLFRFHNGTSLPLLGNPPLTSLKSSPEGWKTDFGRASPIAQMELCLHSVKIQPATFTAGPASHHTNGLIIKNWRHYYTLYSKFNTQLNSLRRVQGWNGHLWGTTAGESRCLQALRNRQPYRQIAALPLITRLWSFSFSLSVWNFSSFLPSDKQKECPRLEEQPGGRKDKWGFGPRSTNKMPKCDS